MSSSSSLLFAGHLLASTFDLLLNYFRQCLVSDDVVNDKQHDSELNELQFNYMSDDFQFGKF